MNVLQQMHIEGVEIFGDCDVVFEEGLNVISGETGSGKSVLLGCLLATLGEDPPRKLLQNGFLESTWQADPPPVLEHLLEDPLWSLGRQVRDGRVSALCGGRSVSASLLREAAEQIMLRSGQHSQQELRQAAYHIQVLDAFADIEAPADLWRRWQDAAEKLRVQKQRRAELQEREDFLRHEVELLQTAPEPGETERLQRERDGMIHATERVEALGEGSRLLREAEEQLALAENRLERIGDYDEQARETLQEIQKVLPAVQEHARALSSHLAGIDASPGRLEEIERRLSEIQALSRRFRGADEEELGEMLRSKEEELLLLDSPGDDLEEEEVQKLREEFEAAASRVHQKRKKAALLLEQKVGEELRDLAVEASFVVRVQKGEPGPHGSSHVEFFLGRSSGEAPLQEAASGGELSRIALALLLAAGSDRKFFVFDEIDTGIGGETAHLLADKLHRLAKQGQVLVVSHLPQIALRADHLLALRREAGQTEIREVRSESDRRKELARLAGARGEESGALLEEAMREAAKKKPKQQTRE